MIAPSPQNKYMFRVTEGIGTTSIGIYIINFDYILQNIQ